jgi:FHA domain-containing protein
LPRPVWEISTAMDAAAHYRHLLSLGRDEFLAAAAPAMLVRYRSRRATPSGGGTTVTLRRVSEIMDEPLPDPTVTEKASEMELYPLAKKPGASFPDRITIGRTLNNDVVIADLSVSRLHAYVRESGGWVVADAGSKNGSWLGDQRLEPRREVALVPGSVVRLGDVRLRFYRSTDLFARHGGRDGGR